MRSVELFVGAGGLAIGMAHAGFKHAAVLEWDHDSCETIRDNQRRGIPFMTDWKLHERDARDFNYARIAREVVVVSGGPPCQPFSVGGKHSGHQDERDMFPEAVRAVRELAPRAFIFENVKGLLRDKFKDYFEYVVLQLTYPELTRRAREPWSSHLSRLEMLHTASGSDRSSDLTYNVVYRVLNAADYGVPQKRERVFIVGFRSDLSVEWSFPDATHTADALLRDQWVTGDYWERHRVAARARPTRPARFTRKIAQIRDGAFDVKQAPWRTVRDVIHDLPDPERYPNNGIANHVHNPGARAYAGHTGSPLDESAKTLKAGDHGVPGGENMLAFPDGRIRYFTVREAARLQTFPDHYTFRGAWSETMRQLGNAVPVQLARAVAQSVAETLREAEKSA